MVKFHVLCSFLVYVGKAPPRCFPFPPPDRCSKLRFILCRHHESCSTCFDAPVMLSCRIPLPAWIQDCIDDNPDLVYTDQMGRRNTEYLSLGVDTVALLRGRTPIQVYHDFMRSFKDEFSDFLGEIITVSICSVLFNCLKDEFWVYFGEVITVSSAIS
jgi:hypothetical protein